MKKNELFLVIISFLVIFISFSYSAYAQSEIKATIKGKILIVHVDDFENHQNSHYVYYLYTPEKRYSLVFSKDYYGISGREVTVTGYVSGDRITADLDTDPLIEAPIFIPAGEVEKPPDSVGEQKTLFILLKNTENESEPFNTQYARNLVFNSGMQSFMQEQSYDQVLFSGDVYGWYAWPLASQRCAFPNDNILGDIVTRYDIDLSKYKRVVYLGKGASGGCSGVGIYNGHIVNNKSYNFSIATVGINSLNVPFGHPSDFSYFDFVLSHELGHSLGLFHSDGLDCGDRIMDGDKCRHLEYGNAFDAMGSGFISLHFNVFQKESLGWLKDKIISITESGIYTINNLESLEGIVGVKIKMNGGNAYPYYLETRRGVGFDSRLNEKTTDSDGQDLFFEKNKQGLFVNKIDNEDPNFPISRLIDMKPTNDLWVFDISRQATLNAPLTDDDGIFNDPDTGISIGPIIEVLSTSTKFAVNIRPPLCNRSNPTITVGEYTDRVVRGGGVGSIEISISNKDSYGCGESAFYISSNILDSWSSRIIPDRYVNIRPGKYESMVIDFFPPDDANLGLYKIVVNTVSDESGLDSQLELPIEIIKKPEILSIRPSYGRVDTKVTIEGVNFANNVMVNMVSKGGTFWSNFVNLSVVEDRLIYDIPLKVNSCDSFRCNLTDTPDGDYDINIYSDNYKLSTSFRVSHGPNDIVPPSAPRNIRWTKITSTSIGLSWLESTDDVGVTGYRVYRSVYPAEPIFIGETSNLFFSNENLIPGKIYSFKLSAVDAAGNESLKAGFYSTTIILNKKKIRLEEKNDL